MIAAEALNLGSCYIGDILENYEKHRQLLNLPCYALPVCMVCIGVPTDTQRKRKKPPRFFTKDIVFENRYQERDLADMLMKRHSMDSREELAKWVSDFRMRKWDSDFSQEMTRSVKAMLDSWLNGD